jgi:hypothetical protein
VTVQDALNNYYNGQRVMTLFGFMGSAIYLLLAWIAATRKGQVSRSFGRTVLVFVALFLLPANTIYFLYLRPQFSGYVSLLARDPSAFRVAEFAHLHKMIPNFVVSISSFSALVCVGLLITISGMVRQKKRWKGVGAGIVLAAVTLLSGEIWSRGHALAYQDSLKHAYELSSNER